MIRYFLIFCAVLHISTFSTTATATRLQSGPELKEIVLKIDPADLEITPKNFKHPVWGIIMEMGLAEGRITLIALADGSTTLYFSNGSGLNGGGENLAVRQAAGHYLLGAQYFYGQSTPSNEYPDPEKGEVRFTFLAFDGHTSFSALESDLIAQKEPISNLYLAASKVVAELKNMQAQ